MDLPLPLQMPEGTMPKPVGAKLYSFLQKVLRPYSWNAAYLVHCAPSCTSTKRLRKVRSIS